jgi:Ca2+-transporting ATPase
MFLLSCNIGEVLIILIATLFNLPIPFKPIHLLYLNLISDAFPALSLGVEPEEEGIMDMPPRKVSEKILDNDNMFRVLLSAVVEALVTIFAFMNILRNGGTLPEAQTTALITLIFSELFKAYSNKTEFKPIKIKNLFNNSFLNLSVFISLLITLLIIYIPFFDKIFYLVPLKLKFFEYLPLSILPGVTFEISKLFSLSSIKKNLKQNHK